MGHEVAQAKGTAHVTWGIILPLLTELELMPLPGHTGLVGGGKESMTQSSNQSFLPALDECQGGVSDLRSPWGYQPVRCCWDTCCGLNFKFTPI